MINYFKTIFSSPNHPKLYCIFVFQRDDNMESDNIDKPFKDSLQSSQREPSKEIWENIEQELDRDDRRASFVRLRFVYLISVCLLALVECLWLLSPKAHREMIAPTDNSGPAATERAIAKDLNNNPGKPSQPVMNTHTGDVRRVRCREVEDPSPGTRSTLVNLQRVTLKTDAQQPDPNQRLLTDQLSRFKKTNAGISPRWPIRWSVTGYFSKEFAGYNLSDHDSIAANGREVDKKEKPVYSASAVVLVSYNLGEKWVLQSGFSYSWSNSLANPTTSYAVKNNGQIKFQVNTLSGYGYLPISPAAPTQVGDSAITGNSFTKLHYLSVPFIASYKFRIRKFTVIAGMGFTLNLLTSATLETKLQGAPYSQDEVEVKMYGLKRMNYGALVKAELQYPIYRNWSLDLVAGFKNTLTPINLHTVISTYPYNLGIGLGISHTF
jgi:hypothetical protein